ncbi:hypothetical protein L1887_47344 [Cichorium endivia]|nr:hypothetical protein L1887_47344 [Cichorium endivia]
MGGGGGRLLLATGGSRGEIIYRKQSTIGCYLSALLLDGMALSWPGSPIRPTQTVRAWKAVLGMAQLRFGFGLIVRAVDGDPVAVQLALLHEPHRVILLLHQIAGQVLTAALAAIAPHGRTDLEQMRIVLAVLMVVGGHLDKNREMLLVEVGQGVAPELPELAVVAAQGKILERAGGAIGLVEQDFSVFQKRGLTGHIGTPPCRYRKSPLEAGWQWMARLPVISRQSASRERKRTFPVTEVTINPAFIELPYHLDRNSAFALDQVVDELLVGLLEGACGMVQPIEVLDVSRGEQPRRNDDDRDH